MTTKTRFSWHGALACALLAAACGGPATGQASENSEALETEATPPGNLCGEEPPFVCGACVRNPTSRTGWAEPCWTCGGEPVPPRPCSPPPGSASASATADAVSPSNAP
jgi:hypothetical protein